MFTVFRRVDGIILIEKSKEDLISALEACHDVARHAFDAVTRMSVCVPAYFIPFQKGESRPCNVMLYYAPGGVEDLPEAWVEVRGVGSEHVVFDN